MVPDYRDPGVSWMSRRGPSGKMDGPTLWDHSVAGRSRVVVDDLFMVLL